MSVKTTVAAPITQNFMKFKLLGLLTALMVLSVPFVYADNGVGDKDSHQAGGWHHGDKDHMMKKILNLTDDQVKQLKDLHQKQRDAMKSTFEQIKANREAVSAEIVKATPDMNKINDLQNQFKTIQSQMTDGHLNDLLAVKKIMTPEQFAGYMALQKERMMKKHMMMHHGKFGHKDGFGKNGDGQKHWGDDEDKD